MFRRLRVIWSWCFAPVHYLLTFINPQGAENPASETVAAALDRQQFSSNGHSLANTRARSPNSPPRSPPKAPQKAQSPLPRDVMIANMPYGSAAVSWIYLASISKWGSLSSNCPVAMLFFEFHFDNLPGYELDMAEFELALHPFSKDYISPQIRQCAPVDLRGTPHTQTINSRVQILPQISVKDVAISGMGTEKGKQWSVDHRWRLEGARLSDPDRRSTGELTRAKWKYFSCKLSSDVEHPHTFRTGCIVDFLAPGKDSKDASLFQLHDLAMDVHIKGKLHSVAKMAKKFKFSSKVRAPAIKGHVIPMNNDLGILKDEFESFLQQVEQSNQKI